ncbi:MAG: outer membrane beta-barrel protein [Flavobacteriaceae bacterium]
MKTILKNTYLILTFLCTLSVAAQGRGGEGKHNMFGLKVGATLFDIKTDNFNTIAESGFIGGLATRGDFYDNWDIQFGINISNNKLKVQARELPLVTQIKEIEYSILNAQVHLLFGYKIFGGNKRLDSKFKLTAELGPVLMINSKMKLANTDQENYIIEDAFITAKELTDVTPININGLVGLSMGLSRLRVFGHYQYGFNNYLNNLNKLEGNSEKFKGHVSMYQFGVLLYF